MKPLRLLLAWLFLLAAGAALAQGEWISYRDAYRAMVQFEKYGKPKHFLQNHYQVSARDGQLPDGLRLTLNVKASQLNLPLDATGRTTFPLLKSAYDENAALVLNRKISQYTFQPRLSIIVRLDGLYEGVDLRSACEQALQYQRYLDAATYGGKRCGGVRFGFLRKAEAQVRVRDGEKEHGLPVAEGAIFDGDPNTGFRIVVYRFQDWPEKVQLISQNAPLAIVPVIE
ncbi:hypothetical protein [Pseudoduganella violacea]|uniref:DUF2987 domain-containing protein n=1 Tax=Pseudoduganella violacea TaxID=1715466 RepID=A0A7W5FSD0_9BURK|nr:hypothetical protein [Pseudoduganella violacea]MBB3117396.1 hypothetical protein [Pseudoduganella violacea]